MRIRLDYGRTGRTSSCRRPRRRPARHPAAPPLADPDCARPTPSPPYHIRYAFPASGRNGSEPCRSIKVCAAKNQLARSRNVLTRGERILTLQNEERWKDGSQSLRAAEGARAEGRPRRRRRPRKKKPPPRAPKVPPPRGRGPRSEGRQEVSRSRCEQKRPGSNPAVVRFPPHGGRAQRVRRPDSGSGFGFRHRPGFRRGFFRGSTGTAVSRGTSTRA